MPKKRITLSAAELDVIITMATIAEAGFGDGDYESWTDKDWKALKTLVPKVAELHRRKVGSE